MYEDPHPELGFMLHPDLKWDQVGQLSSPGMLVLFLPCHAPGQFHGMCLIQDAYPHGAWCGSA